MNKPLISMMAASFVLLSAPAALVHTAAVQAGAQESADFFDRNKTAPIGTYCDGTRRSFDA